VAIRAARAGVVRLVGAGVRGLEAVGGGGTASLWVGACHGAEGMSGPVASTDDAVGSEAWSAERRALSAAKRSARSWGFGDVVIVEFSFRSGSGGVG
jgi:hypothetical protein